MKQYKVNRNNYPGILGKFDSEGGRGNTLNWIRWTIDKLIKLNNWIEGRKAVRWQQTDPR